MSAPYSNKSFLREKEFHEAFYSGEKFASAVTPAALFESPAAFENKFILKFFGDLKNKEILDLGAGTGESSVYFALKGARVIWNDISDQARQKAESLAKQYKVTHLIRFICADVAKAMAECKAEQVDFLYGANVLHHINRDPIPGLLSRLLKKNGKFAFIDPLKYNPVINVYRAMANKIRSPDERPLDFRAIEQFQPFFKTSHREFWLTSMVIFMKFFFIDRVHPNQEPYWKKIFYDGLKSAWLLEHTGKIDNFLARITPLNYLCWNTVIYGEKS